MNEEKASSQNEGLILVATPPPIIRNAYRPARKIQSKRAYRLKTKEYKTVDTKYVERHQTNNDPTTDPIKKPNARQSVNKINACLTGITPAASGLLHL
tara:strand:- start:87 stop:380 length:294 start_codon:yes stop_codon:yes gene_type:complete